LKERGEEENEKICFGGDKNKNKEKQTRINVTRFVSCPFTTGKLRSK
jgi:hypothetical protein